MTFLIDGWVKGDTVSDIVDMSIVDVNVMLDLVLDFKY